MNLILEGYEAGINKIGIKQYGAGKTYTYTHLHFSISTTYPFFQLLTPTPMSIGLDFAGFKQV